MNRKIKSFTDLIAWKEAHKLVLGVYKLTLSFPQEERFGLTNQIRRSAISISSNIAEGFSRKSKKEKKQFYYISKGSLTELQNQLLIAKDIGYLSNITFKDIANQTICAGKLINSIIKNIVKLG